jgi:translocation and assembly module TamA
MARWRDSIGRRTWSGLATAALVGAEPTLCHARQTAATPPPPPAPASQPIAVPPPPPGAGLPEVKPIIPDDEFNAAIPKLDPGDDPELARPLESIDDFERRIAAEQAGAKPQEGQAAPAGDPALADKQPVETIGDAPIRDAELTKPLPPLETFKVEPVKFVDAPADTKDVELVYQVQLTGLADADAQTETELADRFSDLSALRQGKGKAANAAQIASRAGEDAALLKKLLASEGWFDAQVVTRIDRSDTPNGQPLLAVLVVSPGKRFAFSTIKVDAAPTVPPTLIGDNLGLKVGDPVRAEQVLVEEAKVGLALPENGYPFAEVGQRDVLLDPDTGGADYTLPVTVGPRGTYGQIVSEGHQAFGADHIAVLARFKPGELYDSREVDDLRQALIATGLFKGVGIEPRRTGQAGPDGTEVVDIAVKQEAGPPRVIAATAGYSTGEGFRAEASWTHRNFSPPEGALIVSGILGTQEQGAGVTFRRSNAGKRDRSFELAADLHHSDYDAFSAYTGRLAARISYDSTPLWQKRLTYAYGVQLIGTNESVYDFAQGKRVRRTYAIAGLSGQVGFDTSDSLLDPTKGFRLTALIEPEGSVHSGFAPYARLRLDGSAYYRVGHGIVLAGRARVASIQGAKLDDLAPSRRIYGGGGGSVRGFGYQQLGPRDPNNDPIGGRSLNEAAFEVRYRFGDYGVVAFADAGQSYTSAFPTLDDIRVGVGVGGRVYTNFGPMRLDFATPLHRRAGESKINVYVSIGQAF